MYYLNRLRGTRSWWAKVIALGLGAIFAFLSPSYMTGLYVGIGYLIGESMGWGYSIGGLIRSIANRLSTNKFKYDGLNNGIHWLALKFSKVDTDDYYVTWLFIRGLYWWGLTFVSLYWVLDPLLVAMTILFLASWFPISILMAESNDQHWERAENIYGGAQDIGIGILIAALIIS